MSYRVTGLFYYPVKSLKGHSVDQIQVDDFGFQHDRRFMLVDASDKFVTQRKYPILSQCSAELVLGQSGIVEGISIQGPGITEHIGFEEIRQSREVTVWGDQVSAQSTDEDRLEHLSELLGLSIRLVYMPEATFRQIDRDFFAQDQRVGFADGFPVLLTNEASLRDLNSRLELPVSMNRFRPNIIVSGMDGFEEDTWKQVRIGEVVFDCVKPCSRCVMTTIDEHGQKGREPLSTLATYRKNEFGICFGENLVQRNQGIIRLDDSLEILS